MARKPTAGKRQGRKPDPEWEEFQTMVARIEQSLAPKGATVMSPDWIPEIVTGTEREVDASIRFQIGTTPILITVECRRRRRVEDTTWIEQLVTKRAAIGAAKTIAVSSTGFSKNACSVARMHGIELRSLLDRIEEEIVKEFLSGFKVTAIVTDFNVKTATIELEDGTPLVTVEWADELSTVISDNGLDAVIVTDVRSGAGLTARDLIHRAGEPKELVENGPPVHTVLTASFDPHTTRVATRTGPRFVRAVTLDIEFRKHTVPTTPTNVFEYASGDEVFRQTLVAAAPLSAEEGIEIAVDFMGLKPKVTRD